MVAIVRITGERSDLGKPYAKELKNLNDTYEWASKIPIEELISFLKKSARTPLYVIGSGGSFTATTFTSMLHQHIGAVSKCITPLEFLGYDNFANDNSILIITAGGNNSDILASFEKAVESEPKQLAILSASTNNKLTRKAKMISGIDLSEFNLPFGKDGFLATNSLLATMICILRAYIMSFSLPYTIPSSLSVLVYPRMKENEFLEEMRNELMQLVTKNTIIMLYDNWGKAAAIDAESKFVEAGLVNVQLADYRNFAHGRHNWIDKNQQKTGIIALVTPECKKLATKTLNLIPDYIPTLKFDTNTSGPVGTIELLVKIMYSVKIFGDFRNIDPGRPGVPAFGGKIYHISAPRKSFIIPGLSKLESIAIKRKLNNLNFSYDKIKTVTKSLRKFINNLKNEKFGAIVFDYDGTLCDSINRFHGPSKEIGRQLSKLLEKDVIIGIATGRGKSVRVDLQKLIPEKYWSKILIGYYNCSDIGTLDDKDKPDTTSKMDSTLELFLKYLRNVNLLEEGTSITERPKQITIESKNISTVDLIRILQVMNKGKLNSMQVVESTHSIDILAPGVSKLNLLNIIEQKIVEDNNNVNVLAIGDKGNWPGNDFALLSTPYSLSVGDVSNDPTTCWNLVPLGHNGEQAVIDYLQMIEVDHKVFKINTSKLARIWNG